MLSKWTHLNGNGQRRFQPDHPKLKRLNGRAKQCFMQALVLYLQSLQHPTVADKPARFFPVMDVAQWLRAGTGSMSTPPLLPSLPPSATLRATTYLIRFIITNKNYYLPILTTYEEHCIFLSENKKPKQHTNRVYLSVRGQRGWHLHYLCIWIIT